MHPATACAKSGLSLPHCTVILHQAGAPVHLFSDPTGDRFPLSPEPPLSCSGYSVYWGPVVRKESREEHLPWLQPGTTASSPSDIPSLHVVLKGIHPSCYPMCVQGNGDSHNLGLCVLKPPRKISHLAGLARDMTAPPQWKDTPHRTDYTIVFFSRADEGSLESCFLSTILLHEPGRTSQSSFSVWGTSAPQRVLPMGEVHAVPAQKRICMHGGGDRAWPVYS